MSPRNNNLVDKLSDIAVKVARIEVDIIYLKEQYEKKEARQHDVWINILRIGGPIAGSLVMGLLGAYLGIHH